MDDFNTRLAQFIADARLESIDAAIIDKAQKAITDVFAVILSGAASEVAPPVLAYADAVGGAGPCPVLGTSRTASAETAALINGTFAAALDFDDVLSLMPGHPSSVIVPAMCAAMHGAQVSGRDFVEAYVVGVEVGAKIAVGIGLGHYKRGFHGTGTLCMYSAIAALAKLERLGVAETTMAMCIAASMVSGVLANFGSMAKPLHSGLAARSAITAVALARAGFTGSSKAIVGKHGLFEVYGTPESDPRKTLDGLGQPWTLLDPGLALKKYPACYATFRGIDALQQLKSELAFEAENVERIECRVPPGSLVPLPYMRPATGLEAKFSMPYALAAALIDNPLSIRTFSDEAVARPQIAALMSRIDVGEDIACTSRDPGYQSRSYGTRGHISVEVWTRDGRHGRREVDRAPGHPQRELSWADIEAKFADCASYAGVTAQDHTAAFAELRHLSARPSVSPIIDRMRVSAPDQ
jgi:2-methylcitrate dehydratase PrpD